MWLELACYLLEREQNIGHIHILEEGPTFPQLSYMLIMIQYFI